MYLPGETATEKEETRVDIMKLVDIDEALPAPEPEAPAEQIDDTLAENLVKTDKIVIKTAPRAAPEDSVTEEYLPQNKISGLPKFDEDEIKSQLVYPPIAQKSGIEGSVILELFINKQGFVTRVRILKETPENRGFGEAASRAFMGLHCTPAEANGRPVAVRYRYPLRFQLK